MASAVAAQPSEFGPDERRPEVAPPESAPEPLFELPPLERAEPSTGAPGSGFLLEVREWVFEGHTVFDAAELEEVVAPFTGRSLTHEELLAARDALTLHYVDAGYVTSGALIPDQPVEGGRLRVRLVEGALTDVEISGHRWFRASTLEGRISRSARAPLHAPSLEREVRLLQRDSRIQRIDATLRPGERLGESRLLVAVEETSPYRASVETDNHMGPSLGEARGRLVLRHENVAGFGDSAFVLVGGFEAGPEVEAGYRIPFTRYGTTAEARFRYTESDLVDSIGDRLQIEGRFYNIELGLRQPLYETPELGISVGVAGELRDSRIDILNSQLDRTRVTVLSFDQELIWSGGQQVLAARSELRWGIPALNSSERRSELPDSRFVAWLGQVQWARRFDPFGVELLLRGDLQVAAEPLPTLEQLSLGGHASVRGYRENRSVRDQGLTGSAELRIPLWRESVGGRTLVQLAPFFDVGRGWNRSAPGPSKALSREEDSITLYSAGVGLRVQPWRFVLGELYWGRPLANNRGPGGIQGDGLHFRVRIQLL